MKEPTRLTKGRTRAGKRKCSRCKVVWNRAKGEDNTICERCRVHCVRCDVLLTDENKSQAESKRRQYFCKECTAARVRLTKGNKGFKQRDYDLLRNYGITVDEYELMLLSQKGVCWICEKPPKTVRLSVDHLHKKGEKRRDPREKRPRVRGLLCWRCNSALGKFKDNPVLLRKAADYLDTCPAQDILGDKDEPRD